jgi:disease resistance protein RPM1
MESAAMSVVTKFGVLLADELQEIRGVGEKVVYLMDELATMNDVLRMLSEADESTVDHLVRGWTKQVGELAYDSEDCIDIYWIRIRRPIRFLQWPQHQIQKLLLRRTLAADVGSLLARTTAVSERRARYGIDREELRRSACFAPVSAASVSARALRQADDPDQFVGIREEASAMAKAVSKNDNELDKKLKVFSIVGFGGLGKTTMAMELCRQLVGDFQPQAMVSVSQAFDGAKDMKGLLQRVLRQFLKEDYKETTGDSEMELSSTLEKLLNEKRYTQSTLPKLCFPMYNNSYNTAMFD